MRVKYIIKYKKGQKPKQVTGFVRIPKDLPEGFTSEQIIVFMTEKHSLQDCHPLEIKLKNFTSKKFKYEKKSLKEIQGTAAKKAAGNRN